MDPANRIEDAIAERLAYEPLARDRNKKPLGEDLRGVWELRVQPYRVYYVVIEPGRRVTLISVFHKPRETATPLPTE